MPGITLAPGQGEVIAAFTKAGPFATRSEFVRAAVDRFIQEQSEPRRLAVAVQMVRDGATVGRAAEVANVPYARMEEVLAREGLLGARLDATGPARSQRTRLSPPPPKGRKRHK